VTESQRIEATLLPCSAHTTARWMVKLEAMRMAVNTAMRQTSSSSPAGGQLGSLLARSTNHAAKSPPKNMSSDANHTTTPTTRGDARSAEARLPWAPG
jgi:hypothetical protein